jgi:NADP-dependent 3-hydroxy acid dehydrogenase YdfG
VAEIERLFAQNTAGAIRVAQALLPQMRERKRAPAAPTCNA